MKKFVTAVLTLCLICSVAACGGKEQGTETTKGAEKQSQEEQTQGETKATEQGESQSAGETKAEASGKKPVVCLLMSKTTSSYSGAYFNNFKANAVNYPDVEWVAFDAQNDPTLQAQQAEEAIAMGAACIMMQPIDGTALIAAAQKITEADIPLLICNKKLTEEGEPYFVSYFGPDVYEEGQLAADLLHEKYPDGCKYVHLGQDASDETGRLRLAGFQDQAKEKGYNFECLGVSPSCDWSAENGKSYMAAFLTKFSGEIDAVWAIDDAVGYGALQAIEEDLSGENTGIQIVSVGGQEANLNAIEEGGNYLGTIYQSPILESNGAMEIVYDIVTKGVTPEEKYIGMELPVVTKDNVAEYDPAY